ASSSRVSGCTCAASSTAPVNGKVSCSRRAAKSPARVPHSRPCSVALPMQASERMLRCLRSYCRTKAPERGAWFGAGRRLTPSRGAGRSRLPPALHVEPEVQHVAVAHDVVLALEPHLALLLRARLAPAR